MLCPALSAAWRQETGETGLSLAVMALPDTVSLPESHLPEAAICPDTATAVADCNLAVVELTPAQYETAVVNLHLAERRHVGYTVTLRQDGRAVSAAAVTDCGTRSADRSAMWQHCRSMRGRAWDGRWFTAAPNGCESGEEPR